MDFALSCERDFSLEKILATKPLLFFLDKKPERTVRIGDTVVKITLSQIESKLVVTYNKDLTDEQVQRLQERIEFCLGIKENMEDFYLIIYNDLVFNQLHKKIHGTRLVSAFDDFEAIISLLCSQNATYEQYKSSILKLVDLVGKGVFPSPADILTRKSMLARCGIKANEETIFAVSELFQKKEKVTEEDLAKVPGLGEQTIESFILHQRRDYSHFYLDSFTKRIIRTYYGTQFEKDVEVRNFLKRKFSTYAGLVVQYLRTLMNEQVSASMNP